MIASIPQIYTLLPLAVRIHLHAMHLKSLATAFDSAFCCFWWTMVFELFYRSSHPKNGWIPNSTLFICLFMPTTIKRFEMDRQKNANWIFCIFLHVSSNSHQRERVEEVVQIQTGEKTKQTNEIEFDNAQKYFTISKETKCRSRIGSRITMKR